MKNGNYFWKRVMNWFKHGRTPEQSGAGLANGNGMATILLHKLQHTQDAELTCDEVFALLDEYTEMALDGKDVAGLMPLAKQHLDMCPDCREEFEALQRIIQASEASG